MAWSGPAAALTIDFVAGDVHAVANESEHYGFFTISGTVPVSADIRLEVSLDEGVTWRQYPLPVETLAGATAQHVVAFRTPPSCRARFLAKRTGGAADTVLTSVIYPRTPSVGVPIRTLQADGASFAVENAAGTTLDVEQAAGATFDVEQAAGTTFDVEQAAGTTFEVEQAAGDIFEVEQAAGEVFDVDLDFIAGSAVADAAAGVLPVSYIPQVLLGPTSIIDDGGAPPDTAVITDTYLDNVSAWIDLDDACATLALRLNTDVTAPTSIELEIMWHEAAAASAADATSFYSPVVNTVAGGQEECAPRETSWVGRAGVALPNGSYHREYERPSSAASYKVRIKRTGGGAATEAQVTVAQVG